MRAETVAAAPPPAVGVALDASPWPPSALTVTKQMPAGTPKVAAPAVVNYAETGSRGRGTGADREGHDARERERPDTHADPSDPHAPRPPSAHRLVAPAPYRAASDGTRLRVGSGGRARPAGS